MHNNHCYDDDTLSLHLDLIFLHSGHYQFPLGILLTCTQAMWNQTMGHMDHRQSSLLILVADRNTTTYLSLLANVMSHHGHYQDQVLQVHMWALWSTNFLAALVEFQP